MTILKVMWPLAAVTLLFAVGEAHAQNGIPRDTKELEKQIGLTPDQRKKMEAVDKKYQPRFKALDTKYKPKVEALQKQMFQLQQQFGAEQKPLLEAMNKEKEAILSPDQVKKMKAIFEKIRARQEAMLKEMQKKQGQKK